MYEPVPYNIKTHAGADLWRFLNLRHGSGTWGYAGEMIEKIEAEIRQRVINILVNECQTEFFRTAYSQNDHKKFRDCIEWITREVANEQVN